MDVKEESRNGQQKGVVDLTVVIPMYNEEENVELTVMKVKEELAKQQYHWEILIVNDGSTDRTLSLASALSEHDSRVRVVSYPKNGGRGKAMRTGFAHAKGEYIVTVDADLSYEPKYITKLADELLRDRDLDMVIGSPYSPGGDAEDVPFHRLLISKLGNKIVGYAMEGNLHTVTGILRGYRRSAINALELLSDGKEIHLEILSKALAVGLKVKEVPAVLRGRKRGKSKFKFRATAISHLMFSFYEKPVMLFGFIGLILLASGFATGMYISILRFLGTLNPGRPLLYLTVLLVVVGIQMLSFGFLANQLVFLKRNIFIIQKENREVSQKVEALREEILNVETLKR
ncbi:MAG: glycosyltransferase [Candidatus Tectomicrobia bacterium]|nr:glycosyltransferase [Candidatus Tectomicrobia bacterium]